MHLIVNANEHLLHLRRERIVSELNKAFLPIVGDDNNFKEAAPFLFGTEFVKKSTEMVEQVKAMRSTISKKQERKPPFFRGLARRETTSKERDDQQGERRPARRETISKERDNQQGERDEDRQGRKWK